jgi:dipeptidase E
MDHCESGVRQVFSGVSRVLFVPYALKDWDSYSSKVAKRFEAMGMKLESVHKAADPTLAVKQAEAVFVGGGNTFRLLRHLQGLSLLDAIRQRVRAGMPYMGSSAGSNLACPTIMTTNDMPIVMPMDFNALQLVPFQINAHYIDPDPTSTHQGETRETRLREYLEENDRIVIGLREGCWLSIEGDRMTLNGHTDARVFARGTEPKEFAAGADLTSYLKIP